MLHWIAMFKQGCAKQTSNGDTLDSLVEKVKTWGDARMITINSTPQAQLLKCLSELGELADATLQNNNEEVVDGIGDVLVTLIMYAATQDVCLRDCLAAAYDEIKDRKGYLTPEGVFVKEEKTTPFSACPADFQINGYKLVCTCNACPEQYDVFDSTEKQVGYLRLRHGYFCAEYPNCGGELVYEASTLGDGVFDCSEREKHLTAAISAIQERVNTK